jgi:NADH-quinone oxidoreductase subunit G
MRRCGIDNLANLPDGQFDDPLGASTGASDIFGNSGGVMEAVVRTASYWMTGEMPKSVEFHGVFGAQNTREAYVNIGEDVKLHLCVVSGLANARKVLEDVKSGKVHYDAIEVMACPGGCVNGGGQPINKHYEQKDVIAMRKEGLRNIDRNKAIRVSCENPSIKTLYAEFLGEPNSQLAHKLLHTHYTNKQQTFEEDK